MIKRIQGNARGCLLFEPLFLLPYNMFMTYASVYILELGVNETEIGWITSIGMVMQIFTSLISGYLTDRMGRRRALLIYDLISWSLATLIWAFSHNFVHFLIAAIITLQRVPTTAWYCLLVEDTDPKDRSIIFTAIQFIRIIGGIFAPFGGLLVSHFTLVPAMRIMYLIAFISMTVMFIARHYFTYETEISLKKMEASSQSGMKEILHEYIDVIKMVFSNKLLLIIFSVYILFNFQMTLRNTFLSIYLVDALNIDNALISIFPAISSATMIAFLLFVMPRLKVQHANLLMAVGFILSAISFLILLLIRHGDITWTVASTVIMAIGGLLAYPYLEATVANAIDDENRAKIFSVLAVLILLFTFPSGLIGGWTYTINAKIPLMLVVFSFIICVLLVMVYHMVKQQKERDLANMAKKSI